VRRLGTFIQAETSTFRFHVHFAMRFWQTVSREEHRWVANSGWTTFHVRTEVDVKHAVWLMRLSYLRYALKTATDPRRALDECSEELQLTSTLKSLLEPFVPRLAVA
jgi:hypothetical protein